MDAKEVITLLDEIISNIEDDGIKLGKKEIRLINEIVADTEKLILKEEKEDKRQELLSRLDKVSGAISDSESISQESAQKIIDAIEKIKINPIVQVKQPEIFVPEFDTSKINIVLPSEMGIKEPSWLSKVVNLTPLMELLGQIKSIFSKKANEPISVRLSDGEKFYKAIGGASSGGGILPFKNANGEADYAKLNSDNQLEVAIADNLDRFNVNNIKTVGLVTYVGMEDKDGVYCIKKIDSTTDDVFTYATITNNPTVTTYANAWAGILTNTYSIYSLAF